MSDEKTVTDKDLLIRDLQNAADKWKATSEELQATTAQLREAIEETNKKAQELREADAHDWIEHLQGGGCPDGNCTKSRLVKEVFEKGKSEGKSGIDINDVAAWLKEHRAFGATRDSKDGQNKLIKKIKV